jgi:hypothetical protein
VAARAETLRVSIAGNFDLAEPLEGVVPQLAEAFILNNVRVDSVFNGTPLTSTVNTVGWFSHADSFYYGIDIGLDNVLVPGDLMQFVVVTLDGSLYTGTSDAPTLERVELSGLGGAIAGHATDAAAPHTGPSGPRQGPSLSENRCAFALASLTGAPARPGWPPPRTAPRPAGHARSPCPARSRRSRSRPGC